MLVAEPEKGLGNADVVVEVAIRLEHPKLLAEHSGGHILGSGLAHAAGDGDDLDIELAAIISRQVTQRQQGVRHQDIELIRPVVRQLVVGEGTHGAVFQGLSNVGVTIEPLPHQGDKEGALGHGTAVGIHRAYLGVQVHHSAQQGSAGGLQNLTQCHCFHSCCILPSLCPGRSVTAFPAASWRHSRWSRTARHS